MEGERSGLLTRTARESISSCAPMTYCAFLELETATRVRGQLDLTRNKMPDGAARGVSKRLSGKCSN